MCNYGFDHTIALSDGTPRPVAEREMARLEARRVRSAKPDISKQRSASDLAPELSQRQHGFQEEEIRVALTKCLEQRDKTPEEEQKEVAFKRRLEKAGYEGDADRLLNLTSLMDGTTPFLNSEVWNLDQRHHSMHCGVRTCDSRNLQHPRISRLRPTAGSEEEVSEDEADPFARPLRRQCLLSG